MATMASPATQSWQKASQVGALLSALLRDKAPPRFEDVDTLIEQLRIACEATILADFEYANRENVEKCLWDHHVKINQRYRKIVDHFKQDDQKKHVVERRKFEKRYADFIKTSQFFYKGYIQRLASHFEGMKELRRIAHRLSLDSKTVDQRVTVSPKVARLIDLSCHGTLLRLGDLSRYRNHLRIKERSWAAALGYYELANDFMPEDGSAHNQMAIIALADGNHLDAIYHLYRALAVNVPHILAKGNLEIEFNKIKSIQEKKHSPPKSDSMSTLVWWFVLLHAKFYDGVNFQTHDELENEVLSRLALLLKEESFGETLQKVVLINMSAEYIAKQRMRDAGDNASQELSRSYHFILALNIRMTFMLLHVLEPELEDQSYCSDISADTTPTSSHEKVTAIARRVLPALRHYSIWLVSEGAGFIISNVGNVVIHAKELWKMYANVLTRLIAFYPIESLLPVNYLLDEDEITIGFKPLRDSAVPQDLSPYHDENGVLKPHVTDSGSKRSLPNEEMKARVRDIVICSLILHKEECFPISLVDGKAFVFDEEHLTKPSGSSLMHSRDSTPSYTSSLQPTADFTAHGPVSGLGVMMPPESLAASDSLNSTEIPMHRHEEWVDSLVEPSSRHTADNETSYGMHSRTANEVFAPIGSNGFHSHQIQSPPNLPSLPGQEMWNSVFTPQPHELQAISPNRLGTGNRMSPMATSSAEKRFEAAQQLERETAYGRSSQDHLGNLHRSPRDSWGGKRASNHSPQTSNSQAINEILQRSLAEQFNPLSIGSPDFSNSSSLYANTPMGQQRFQNGGIRNHLPAANIGNNSTYYSGASTFDRDAMLQSSLWNGSQPLQTAYTQTPPSNQNG